MELRYGTADENVRKRSILDVILRERQKTKKEDQNDSGNTFPEKTIQPAASLFCPSRAGELAVVNAVNSLAENGIRAGVFFPVILLPPGTQESILRGLMHQICRTAFELEIEIGEVHAEVTSSVIQPVIVGTAAGDRVCSVDFYTEGAQGLHSEKQFRKTDPAGLDIVLAGPVGLEGTCILVEECRDFLLERFPLSILARMNLPAKELCILETVENLFFEIEKDRRSREEKKEPLSAPAAMVSLGDGGFFTGLWKLSTKTGYGLEVDLQAVPILQETIEITNELGINPYAMRAAGSLLIAARDGERLAEHLLEKGRICARIGKLTAGRDRILRNGEEIRYLDRPQTDALAKLLSGDFLS